MALSVPIHPIVVHFPIALLSVYVIIEILAAITKKEIVITMARVFLGIGAISILVAALTGNYSAHFMRAGHVLNEQTMQMIEAHETFATLTIWYFSILAVLHMYFFIQIDIKKRFARYKTAIRYIAAVLAIAGGISLFYTGATGGELVFKKGVGTELMHNEK